MGESASPPSPVPGGLSVINLGDLTKPATVLIEKIADAVGGLYRPTQIKRLAAAEGEAKLILANADIQVSELQQRAVSRMLHEEGQKQANMESITAQAVEQLKPDAKPENVEQDWLAHFFERSRLTSDAQMQTLWAMILAGEANAPGSFSRRTVDYVSTLERRDAELFTGFCGYCWMAVGTITPLIFEPNGDIYKASGVNFNKLSHLADLGLIRFHNLTVERKDLPPEITVHYYGIPVTLHLPEGKRDLPVGRAQLTVAGHELAPICGSKPVDGFLDYVLKRWGVFSPVVGTLPPAPSDKQSS